ncbi:MAG: hypothetical protein ABI833_16230 [Acidobacteriota bacterium]
MFLLGPLNAQIKIHLIGTGGTELTPARVGAATLIETPAALLLLDAGRGVWMESTNPACGLGT